MRALVIGATGMVGRRVAAELARSEEVDAVTMAARNQSELARVAAILGGAKSNISNETCDISDAEKLRSLARGVDVIVNCAAVSGDLESRAVGAAISTSVPYVSSCEDGSAVEQAMTMHDAAAGAGCTVICGCGFSPGMTNLLAAIGAGECDGVEAVEVSIAMSARDADGTLPTRSLSLLARDAIYVSDAKRAMAPAGTVPKPVYFPEPVGWVETFRAGHPEVITLARSIPGLEAVAFRFGISERSVMDVTRALSAAGLLGSTAKFRASEMIARTLTPLLEKIPPRGSPWSAARVDVYGEKDGRAHAASLGVTDHLVNLVTVPMVRAALELGSGRTSKPGVWGPEQVLDAGSFLKATTRRGLRIARLEPAPV